MEGDEQFDLTADDGLFFINFKSFRTVFDQIFIAQNFPDDWNCIRYASAWIEDECAGGLPTEGTPDAMIRYASNPQFLIQPESDCEAFFSLGQHDGRLQREDGSYHKYPFKELLRACDLTIWQLGPNEKKLSKYDKTKLMVKSGPPVKSQAISLRAKLKKGQSYIVVPATLKPNEASKFYLSIYLSCSLHDVNIERVGNPLEKCKYLVELFLFLDSFIKEEYEKSQRGILPWKLQWVKDQVSNNWIVTNNDKIEKNKARSRANTRQSRTSIRRTPNP